MKFLLAAQARGRKGDRPRKKSVASNVAKRLRITTTTLYMYVNGDVHYKKQDQKLLILISYLDLQAKHKHSWMPYQKII